MHESYYLRFLTKFTFDILPAALASVIAGFLFTQYKPTADKAPETVAAAPARVEETLKMVHDEHSMIVNFLKNQRAAEAKRNAEQDAARVKAKNEAAEAKAENRPEVKVAVRRPEAANRPVIEARTNAEMKPPVDALKQAEIVLRQMEPGRSTGLSRPAEPARTEPARQAESLRTAEPVRSTEPVQGKPMEIASVPAMREPVPPAASAEAPRPPAEITNAPRRVGPVGAALNAARDVTEKAVSTVLEIPAWIGERVTTSPPRQIDQSGRFSSAEY
ncbi:MAG: hypothetical protein AB7K04_12645 [Pseudorhodoplanes sp.]